MIEIKIEKGDAGQRLNKYLMKYLSHAPSSFIYKMLRKKNIVLNNKKAKGDEILCDSDIVKLFLSDDTIEKFRGKMIHNNDTTSSNKTLHNKINIQILYEDTNIMAVHKKMGVLSQKTKSDDYSINEAIVDYILANKDKYGYTETFKPSVCNRLDYNTSGIILAGITLKGSQYLSKALKDRTLDKYYYTIVKGRFAERITCKGYIKKDRDNNYSKVISQEEYSKLLNNESVSAIGYSMIETEFIPVSAGEKCTLLKIKLITGKSHQIRAHLKELGHPVAGDIKYGESSFNRYLIEKYKLKNHLLHAGQVRLSEDVVIEDPLPNIFMRICDGEGIVINS